jgi:hypothetical protein
MFGSRGITAAPGSSPKTGFPQLPAYNSRTFRVADAGTETFADARAWRAPSGPATAG